MKASEAKRILCVTQKTINAYIKKGKLHPIKINSNHYEYDEEEVFALLGKGRKRKTILYSRVSLRKQKNDLESQKKRLYDWATSNGYTVDEELSDIKTGMSFNERPGFCKLIDMVSKREVETVIIENRDRITRFGFEMLEHMFSKLGAKILIISNIENKTYEKELTDDLISIIHYYSMKAYSMRRKLHIAEQVLLGNKEVE